MKLINCLATLCLAVAMSACAKGQKKIDAWSKVYAEQTASREAPLATDEDGQQPAQDVADGKRGRAAEVQELEIPAPLKGLPEQILRRVGYTVSYNSSTRQPNWVAWHLTREHTEGNVKRPRKAFHEDDDVDYPKATDDDYYNSGYDRGHMCPAADNKWDEDAMMESFLFTNMCPQNHGLNVGDWNEMENQCRRWAKKYGDIYIVCGPILYKSTHKRIGRNKVVVPEAFFKVVLCMEGTPKAIGFICRNQSQKGKKKTDFINTIDDVERITGYDFFSKLPDDIEDKVEAHADINEW